MKNTFLILAFASTLLISCKKEIANSNVSENDTLVTSMQNIAAVSDFKSAADFDNVADVPFSVYSKKDSVSLYTKADLNSKYLKIENNNFRNYYGFEEVDAFFVLHYQIQNNPRKTVVAYVSKDEFVKDSQLSLAKVNINEIRSSAINDADDFKNKSFAKMGNVSLITKNEYLQGKNNISEGEIKPNPKMKFDGVSWSMESYDEPFVILKHNREDSDHDNEYLGFCARINREIFIEKDNLNNSTYYVGFDVYNREKQNVYFSGFPILLPANRKIATINSNPDVGSDFALITYDPATNDFINNLYVNFTNFKIIDSKKMFWVANNILYFEAVHTNTNTRTPDYKIEYLKLELF